MKTTMKTVDNVLRIEVELIPGELGSVIGRTFKLMGVAEEEIALAKVKWPEEVETIHGAFKYLCPPAGMSALVEEVYRHHCRELLARTAQGRSRRPGTVAEVMVALSETSLATPLTHDATVAYVQCFSQVFGRDPWEEDEQEQPQPTYPGAVEEIIEDARRKLAKERKVDA